MWRGDLMAVLCVFLMLLDTIALASVLVVSVFFPPQQAEAVTFACRAHDRPVMESMPRVWQARATGICEFDFDGVHYVVENMPKEYVDYSAWYVRLP